MSITSITQCFYINIFWHIFFLGLNKSITTIVLKMKREVRKNLPRKERECISYFKMSLTGSAGIRGVSVKRGLGVGVGFGVGVSFFMFFFALVFFFFLNQI